MTYRTPTAAGLGVGALGVAVTALATILLAVIPDYPWAATRAARIDAILRWSGLVLSVGETIQLVGLPLLSAVLAWSLVRDRYTPRAVLRGFVVGGLAFGVSVALVGEVTMSLSGMPGVGRSLTGHLTAIVARAGRLAGGALVGILCSLATELR